MSDPAPPDRTLNHCSRRRLLCGVLETALVGLAASSALVAAATDTDPRKLPPQLGDELAYSSDDGGKVVTAAEIKLHAAPIIAYPRDPHTQEIRERWRLNQILLLRFTPKELSAETRANAADGIVAYSAICTHAACGVSEWNATTLHLICPCHASQYDPRQRAVRVAGPAPRALPALPIKQTGNTLTITGPFSGQVGAEKS